MNVCVYLCVWGVHMASDAQFTGVLSPFGLFKNCNMLRNTHSVSTLEWAQNPFKQQLPLRIPAVDL